MAGPPKNGKLIYHLTSLENLENIFVKGLLSRNQLDKFDDVADKEIIDRRIEKNLNDYIPFHFFAGTPFAGAVQKRHNEKEFVFITVHRSFAERNDYKILTQHPLSLTDCTPLRYNDGFKSMDWDTMAKREYGDHQCCEICMAECLAPTQVAPSSFFSIYTKTQKTNHYVSGLRNKLVGANAFHVNVFPEIFVK